MILILESIAACALFTLFVFLISREPVKIVFKLCKKYPKLRGGCYMFRPEDIEKVLQKLPAEDVWGIGRRSMRKLEGMGVVSAWDYTQLLP